jgi:membrane associated rhomboid family serine protease
MKKQILFSNKMIAVYCILLVVITVIVTIKSEDYHFPNKTNISEYVLKEMIDDGSIEKLLIVQNSNNNRDKYIEVWLIDSLKSRYIESYPELSDNKTNPDFLLKVFDIDSFLRRINNKENIANIKIEHVERYDCTSYISIVLTFLLFGLIIFIFLRFIYGKTKHTLVTQYLVQNKPKIALIISGILFVFLWVSSSKSAEEFVILKPQHLFEPKNYYRFLLYIAHVKDFSDWIINSFIIVLFGYVVERYIKTLDVIKLLTISYVFGGLLHIVIAKICGESYGIVSPGILGKILLYLTVFISVIRWKKLNVFERIISVIGYVLLLLNMIDFVLVISHYLNRFPIDKVIYEFVFIVYLFTYLFFNKLLVKIKSNN